MRISAILKKHRLINEIEAKALAADIGINVATLYRIEAGGGVDGDTLIKIIDWLCGKEKGGT